MRKNTIRDLNMTLIMAVHFRQRMLSSKNITFFVLLLILTASGYVPGGSDTTIQ
jgi:hypothetical protein